MIIQETAIIKISPSNYTYWKNKGYDVGKTGGRAGKNTKDNLLTVKVSDLQSGSNVSIRCKCDLCGTEYDQRYCRNTFTCYKCRRSIAAKGNTYGKANKGKILPHMRGELHPRWNPNKTEYAKYSSEVWQMTRSNYRKYIGIINPDRLPRRRCGVEGGYQLDHKISVYRGFHEKINPAEIADVSNLQMLAWEHNRSKSK